MVKPKQNKTAPIMEEDLERHEGAPSPEIDSLKNLGTILEAHSAQFEKILTAIQDTKSALETKIDTVTQDVSLL